MVEVHLAPLERASLDRCERTYTDNISAHGARVHSTGPWQQGEKAEIALVKGEGPRHGEVVYCQKVSSERFFVGLKFSRGGISWSILEKFNGLSLADIFGAMRW